VYTVSSLDSLNIVLDTQDIIIKQQLSNVVGATRMGTVFGNNVTSDGHPSVGTTTPGMFLQNSSTAAGNYTFTGYSANSSAVYSIKVTAVPEPETCAAFAAVGLVAFGFWRRRSA